MKVLIIGGTGLISTAIVEQLKARGDEVTLLNRGLTEKRFLGEVEVLRADRWDYPAFEATLAPHRFDAVIDMVAFHPDNARSLLRACQGRTKHIVMCSTVCVYGGPLTRLPARDDEPHRSKTDYGRNKSAIERVILEANGAHGTFTTVLRPSFTTGEGATTSGVLFDDSTPDRLRRGLPVIVHDGGKAAWAVAHVSDVGRGFVNAIANERAFGEAYHLTSHEHTTWKGVFEAMAEAAGKTLQLAAVPTDFLYAALPRRAVGVKFIYQYDSIFDNTKAERDLDFRTTVPLVETFRRQLAWMERERKIIRAEDEPLTDAVLAAMRRGEPKVDPAVRDYNPWGNSTTN